MSKKKKAPPEPDPEPIRRTSITDADMIVMLEEMARMLELTGANVFKVIAYSNAAQAIESLPEDIEKMVASKELLNIHGIGKGIFKAIKQMLETGTFEEYEELRATIPHGLLEVMQIPGLGPKKVKAIHDKLGVASIDELEQAANDDKIAGLPGFGAKSQENILKGIERHRKYSERFLLSTAKSEAQALYEAVVEVPGIQRSMIGGSIRRHRETVRDIDILVSTDDAEPVMERFTTLPQVSRVVAKGPTKSSVTLKSGMNADLRVVHDNEYPFACHYFTGSKQHNTAMRGRAKKMGYKLNEYGLFEDDKPTPCKDEEALFAKLGLDWVPPVLREATGEIEAAAEHALPKLVTEKDFKGIFHVHTNYSDGAATLEEMALGAKKLGMQYLGVSDHSKTAAYAGGMAVEKVLEQADEIARLNKTLDQFTILHGIESDILADGALDYPDDILERFDFVIVSIHSIFNLDEAAMTARMVEAIEHPCTSIVGHPTGRLLLGRDPYALDVNAVIDACAACGVAIEINSHPSRLDLDWRWARIARDKGVKIVVGPDAHTVKGMEDFRYGIGVAQKAWLEAGDVLNTLTAKQVMAHFAARK